MRSYDFWIDCIYLRWLSCSRPIAIRMAFKMFSPSIYWEVEIRIFCTRRTVFFAMAVPACLPLCDVRTAHRSEVLLSVRIVKCRIVFRIGRKTTTDEMNEAKIVRLCS